VGGYPARRAEALMALVRRLTRPPGFATDRV